jgi:hypothetical protein
VVLAAEELRAMLEMAVIVARQVQVGRLAQVAVAVAEQV